MSADHKVVKSGLLTKTAESQIRIIFTQKFRSSKWKFLGHKIWLKIVQFRAHYERAGMKHRKNVDVVVHMYV